MITLILHELAVKGIWQLIKEAVKAMWKGVKKRPPSESSENNKKTPPGKKRKKGQKGGSTKLWCLKFEYKKKVS